MTTKMYIYIGVIEQKMKTRSLWRWAYPASTGNQLLWPCWFY